MSNDESFAVNFSSSARYDIEEIRRRKEAFMPDGEHAWVISTVFALDDPEQNMDEMELGAENFIGVSNISCLLCWAPYRTEIRRHKCPQTLTKASGYTCPRCGRTSHHPADGEHGYCAACHDFTQR